MKYSYGYANFLFKYSQLSENFSKISKSSVSNVLANESENRKISKNRIHPFDTDMFFSIVLARYKIMLYQSFYQLIFRKIDDNMNTEIMKCKWYKSTSFLCDIILHFC